MSYLQRTLAPQSPTGVFMCTFQFAVSTDVFSVCLVLDTKNAINDQDAKIANAHLFWVSPTTGERVFVVLPYVYDVPTSPNTPPITKVYYPQHNQLLQSLGLGTVGDLSFQSQSLFEQFKAGFRAYYEFTTFLFDSVGYGGSVRTLFYCSTTATDRSNSHAIGHDLLRYCLTYGELPTPPMLAKLARFNLYVYEPSDLLKTDVGSFDCGSRLLRNVHLVQKHEPIPAFPVQQALTYVMLRLVEATPNPLKSIVSRGFALYGTNKKTAIYPFSTISAYPCR